MESISHHQAALDDLLSTGEMDFETARQLQSAYRAAARLAGGLEISPTSKDEIRSYDSGVLAAAMLLRQCRLLARMAARRIPSPETSAEAERAIARAICLSHPVQAENRRVSKYAYRPGPGQRLSFDELYLQVSPVSQAAARFLVDVVSVRHSG
jgi:hypothetical protein